MKKALSYITIIMIVLVASAVILFAQADTTAVKNFWQSIDYKTILKWVGIIVGGIGAGGISFNVILGIILKFVPNPQVFIGMEKLFIFITKLFRQKMTEDNVDTVETTLVFALKGAISGLKKANPDLPDK